MGGRKPTVYLDTTIVSALFFRGRDLSSAGRQVVTRDWWSQESCSYRVYASDVTKAELGAGEYPWKRFALAFVSRLPLLPYTRDVRTCARLCVDERLVPASEAGDALQLAFAVVHRMDYLLTWNYAHLANLETQRRAEKLCRDRGWRCPVLASPDTIPKVLLGQRIRRKTDD